MNFVLSHLSYMYSSWLLRHVLNFLPSHLFIFNQKFSTGFCVISTETWMIYTGFCRISTGSRIALTDIGSDQKSEYVGWIRTGATGWECFYENDILAQYF